MLEVFLGGEGNNDIGTRSHTPMGDDAGVVEALLRRVRPTGWRVAGARSWQSIRKYRARAAIKEPAHRDAHNVRGLVLHAYEDACEMLAFVRNIDGEDQREEAIRRALDHRSARVRRGVWLRAGHRRRISQAQARGLDPVPARCARNRRDDSSPRRSRAASDGSRGQIHCALCRDRGVLRPSRRQGLVARMARQRRRGVSAIARRGTLTARRLASTGEAGR